jgi:2-phosphoglycolate phosphatase
MSVPEHEVRRHLIAIDLDGTIEDSRDDMVAAAVRVRAELGLPRRGDEQLRPFVNGGMESLYRACFDDFLPPGGAERLAEVQRAYEADYLAHVADRTQLYPDMAAVLVELAALGELACVTNKPEHISRALLAALGVGEHFSTVVGGDSCAHGKPHPIMLQTAADRCCFEWAHGKAIMIGDTNADIQLARSFGAYAVWCSWGYVSAPSDAPDAQARRPSELIDLARRQLG